MASSLEATGVVCDERGVRAGGRESRGAWVALALVLALVQVALLSSTAWDKSDTGDESQYVAAAATLWANGDVAYLCGAPALPRWGTALALAAVDGAAVAHTPSREPLHYVFKKRDPGRLRVGLFAARVPTIVAVVLGGLVLWSAARRFGAPAATVTHALWCLSPTVLANGSLATLDAWAAACMCAVLWACVRLRERPSVARAAVVGAACGCAAGCKMTALGIVPLAGIALLVFVPRGIRARALVAGALMFVGTIWAAYDFTLGDVHVTTPCDRSPTGASIGQLPAPAWIEGLLFQVRHGSAGQSKGLAEEMGPHDWSWFYREGQAGYLAGQASAQGWWWFYLVCLALKITIGAQALALLASIGLALHPTRGALLHTAVLLAYPLTLLVALSASRHQGGIAFLLPAFPFVMLWCGSTVAGVARGPRGRAAVAACLALGALEMGRVHPHHLMFFNLWAGGPSGGPRYLVHRDDWGQDDRRLAVWQRKHGIARVYFASYGENARRWGVVGDPVPCEPTPGVYALHAIEVHRPKFSLTPGCIDWLTVEPPDKRLGYSIYLYTVDEARLARLRLERATARPFWRSGPPPGPADVAFPAAVE